MAPITSSDQLEAYKAQALKDFRSATAFLQDKREDVQARFVEPAVDFVSASAQRQPVATTFLLLFAALSFVPVASFVFFSVATIVGSALVIGGGALLLATVFIGWFVGSAALLLVGTLLVTASIAGFATFSLLSGYAALRFFAILGRADTLPEALQQAREEATNLLIGRKSDSTSDSGKKVRINGVVKSEGEADKLVKLDGVQ
ncbi:hypothetical protein JCM8547_001450 [Rhodosporidiobolus lusitaniae]